MNSTKDLMMSCVEDAGEIITQGNVSEMLKIIGDEKLLFDTMITLAIELFRERCKKR